MASNLLEAGLCNLTQRFFRGKNNSMKPFKTDGFDSMKDFFSEIYCHSEKIFDPAEDLKNLKDKNGASIVQCGMHQLKAVA